jgi:protein gp37
MVRGRYGGIRMAMTSIAWTWTELPDGQVAKGYTFQAWGGCECVSEGCDHCYAWQRDLRYHGGRHRGEKARTPRKRMSAAYWRQPHTWNRAAARLGVRLKVFCASLADVFEDHPDVPAARERLWRTIEDTPWLTWMLLTKRPANIRRLVPPGWLHAWPERVWLGTSVETAVWARVRIPLLLKVPARVRFLSVEPLLGPQPGLDLTGIHWAIIGGESGPEYRSMDLAWMEDVVAQCGRAGVPVFIKQDSGPIESRQGRLPDDLWRQKAFPDDPAPLPSAAPRGTRNLRR